MSSALIVVDVQVDFCEGGALGVDGGERVAADVAALVSGDHGYDLVAATRDRHVDPGWHFAEEPDYVDTWPVHCVDGTAGADFHAAVRDLPFDAVFDKGQHDPGYSGFDGTDATTRPLSAYLRFHRVERVDVVGIATDHCVRATALDATGLGFTTTVRLGWCAGVAPETTERALAALRAAGVRLKDEAAP